MSAIDSLTGNNNGKENPITNDVESPKQVDKNNDFTKGYLCAIANLINMHGYNTEADDLFKGCGLYTEYQMKKAGIDPGDIKTLRPVIKEYHRKKLLYTEKNN